MTCGGRAGQEVVVDTEFSGTKGDLIDLGTALRVATFRILSCAQTPIGPP